MTLNGILDEVIELLQHPEFKTFGALQKHKYQMSKPEEDKEIRSIMYEGQLIIDKDLIRRQQESRKKKLAENPELLKKAAEKRAAWYKNPDNYKKFKKAMERKKQKKN